MNIVVIGLGSMGKRRIRLLKKHYKNIKVVGVDNNPDRRITCENEYNIKTYNDINEAIKSNQIECSFICTSPISHSKIINDCLRNDIHVFSELNLISDGYEDNINTARQKNLVLFMSSTLLYREEIKYIKELVQQNNNLMNYVYHVGQYLPDWHPWESYNDYFVGDKRTNGCREIFAIELPWLIDIFGDIEKIDVVKSKMSSLNIDYYDNYLLLIQHKNGHKGTLAVDVISRKAVRNLEVFGEQLHVCWNGSPTGLNIYDYGANVDMNVQLYEEIDKLENYSSFIVENAYSSEISSFFEAVIEKEEPIYNFEKDLKVLKIIDRIEA